MSFAGRPATFRWDLGSGVVSVLAAVLCLVPTLGFLAAWHLQVTLADFTRWATIPALLALAACEFYLVRRSPLLFNRLASGLVGGLVATFAFAVFHAVGSWVFGGAPDFGPVVGQHLRGELIGIAPSAPATGLGYAYEYLLMGSLLGGAYSLLIGRGRWYWAMACGIVAGIGFVLLPQFRLFTVAMGFSLGTVSAIYVVSAVLAGAVLGAVVHRLGRTQANAFYVVFLREEQVERLGLERERTLV